MKIFWHISEAEQQLALRMAAILAIPLAVVLLIPSLFGIYLINRESDSRAKATRELIRADQRSELLLVGFVCAAIEIGDQYPDKGDRAREERFRRMLREIGHTCD